MKVLVVTNLFGYPWDPSRGVFNQQQFDRLAQRVDLRVLVAVPWTEAIRRPRAYWHARREGRKRWPYVDYFLFWYLPGIAQALHPPFFFASMILQRAGTIFFTRWDAMLGSWGYPDAVATAIAGRITGTPVLMKVHGTDVNDYLQVPSKRWQILAAARRCHAVIAVSAALRERLIEAGLAPDHVKLLYNGVDTARFERAVRGAARARLGMAAGDAVVLFVGNLKTAKGCIDLLDAFARIGPLQPRLKLVYIGDGEARSAMQQRVTAAALSGRVRFEGRLDHAKLPDWFVAADLLCLPSHAEGVPNVVLEAMASGLPVVATRVGGIPEVLPEFAGLLVPPRDGVALAQALQSALARSWDSARIAAHARSFDWESNIDRLMGLLAECTVPNPATELRP